MYVWSKHAFGDFSGFLTGWVYWISNLPYFPAVLYFAASNALYVARQSVERTADAVRRSSCFSLADWRWRWC